MRKRIAVMLLVIVQVVLTAVIAYLGIRTWSEDRIGPILDTVIALVGVALVAYASWEKDTAKRQASTLVEGAPKA